MTETIQTLITAAGLFVALGVIGYAVGLVDDRRRRNGRR